MLDGDIALRIAFRWVHMLSAAVLIGGAVFMQWVLPAGTRWLDTPQRQGVFLRCRRAFKIVVHSCILLLVASGVYNSIRLWPAYSGSAVMHGLWGGHVLLAIAVSAILLFLLIRPEPPRPQQTWMLASLLLLFVLVAAASTLKQVRENALARSGPTTAATSRSM